MICTTNPGTKDEATSRVGTAARGENRATYMNRDDSLSMDLRVLRWELPHTSLLSCYHHHEWGVRAQEDNVTTTDSNCEETDRGVFLLDLINEVMDILSDDDNVLESFKDFDGSTSRKQ